MKINHENIISYCERPFKSLDHMNMELVRRWNEVVSPKDTTIYLGDFCFNRREKNRNYWKDQLNGNIIFLQGNHEEHNEAPIQSLVLKYGGIDWWCQHYPDYKYKYNLCAHVHNNYLYQTQGERIVVNVGADVHNFYPITINEIIALMPVNYRRNL